MKWVRQKVKFRNGKFSIFNSEIGALHISLGRITFIILIFNMKNVRMKAGDNGTLLYSTCALKCVILNTIPITSSHINSRQHYTHLGNSLRRPKYDTLIAHYPQPLPQDHLSTTQEVQVLYARIDKRLRVPRFHYISTLHSPTAVLYGAWLAGWLAGLIIKCCGDGRNGY